MYKQIDKDYVDYVAKNLNKSTKCVLRLYENEVAYTNGVYVEISGDNYLKTFEYNSSINADQYINYGDVCSAEANIELITNGYEDNDSKLIISKLKEFAIISPYFLQTGRWENFASRYKIRGSVCVKLDDITEVIVDNVRYAREDVDETIGYVAYQDDNDTYKYLGFYYVDTADRSIKQITTLNADYFNCFPMGKLYLSSISTNDYYRNISVSAYDVLGFSDVLAKDIEGVAPTVNYSTAEGLINYFLWENGLVDYQEDSSNIGQQKGQYNKSFTQLVSEIFSFRRIVGANIESFEYRPSQNDSIRTLIGYIAGRGYFGKKSNAVVNRSGQLSFKSYEIAQYSTGSEVLEDYSIDEEQILAFNRNGLPFENGLAKVWDSTLSWKTENEENGSTEYSSTYGNTNYGLNFSYPTPNTMEGAMEAIAQLYHPLNRYFDDGLVVEKIVPSIVNPSTFLPTGSQSYLYICPATIGFKAYKIRNVNNKLVWRETQLNSFIYTPANITWIGDLNLDCGDVVIAKEYQYTDSSGKKHYWDNKIPIMSMNIRYDGGITQILKADGGSSNDISLSQSKSGSSSLNAQIQQGYTLINNSIKKLAKNNDDNDVGMTVLVDSSADDVTESLVISQYTSNDTNHNWLNEGNVTVINSKGVKCSTNGYRGEYSSAFNKNNILLMDTSNTYNPYYTHLYAKNGVAYLTITCQLNVNLTQSSNIVLALIADANLRPKETIAVMGFASNKETFSVGIKPNGEINAWSFGGLSINKDEHIRFQAVYPI